MNKKSCVSKTKFKKPIWNVAAEVLKREYGLRKCGGDSFHSDCYSSDFVVKRMQLSHHLTNLPSFAPIIDFNGKGDLLCAGCICDNGKKNHIILTDWARNKINAEIIIENVAALSDLLLINTVIHPNEISLVSAYENGFIRHDTVPPSGKAITLRTHQMPIPAEHQKLAKCLNNEHEILSAASSGNIYGIDLRCEQDTPTTLAQTKPVGKFVKLHAISHHPLRPQVAAAYSDFNVRIFDKRKFDRPLHEICPQHLADTNSFASFANCLFSYDGSEILAAYNDEKIYLFNSDNTEPGDFKRAIDQQGLVGFNNKIGFFGTKSEYILIGNDNQCIGFYDKLTGQYETDILLREDARFYSVDLLALKSHPHLPVVAVSVEPCGLSIVSPSGGRFL